MPSKEEKRRRAKIVEAIVAKDTAEAIERMPISFKDLGALFNHLDEVFGNEGCDHTLKITTAFLNSKSLNKEKIIPWLGEYGGYCDCEVLANVEDSWESEIDKNT
jgi:hypothetical protein